MKNLYWIIAGCMVATLLGMCGCKKDVKGAVLQRKQTNNTNKNVHHLEPQTSFRWWRGERYRCWDSGDKEFCVLYPNNSYWKEDNALTNSDCLVAEAPQLGLKMIAKRYYDRMPLEEKYEALKSGATTSSVGDDFFLLAGRMYDDMRFFEKDIKGDGVWYYVRVEFPVRLTKQIDPLLQYVKDYQLNTTYLLPAL
ncbi:MAG: hypothetical protein IJV36_00330 [Prevotella sp.]|nr:hypothetical protein [Prevotella sp.]